MISVDEALALVLSLADAPRGEVLALDQAAGRILLEPAVSRMTQPPFDSAAMDGYALRHADLGQRLRVVGEAAAGHPWTGSAEPGTAIRIFTGGAVPPGYDRVEMQENTQRDGDWLTVTAPSRDAYIRKRGCDFGEGDRIEPGRRLSPADIALLAAMNLPQVTVAKRPKVAVLAGGDELVRPGETPSEGQIISSNDLAVAAIARAAGAEAEILPIARDSEDSLRDRFARARDADLLVTIGGASVGDHDLIGKVAEALGMERAFYKIAMRPGKPLMAGRIGRGAMLGLPGNPVSAIVCANVFMRPLIHAMQGLTGSGRVFRARLAAAMPPEGARQHYLRAKLRDGEDLPLIAPFDNQDSSLLSVLAQADALMIRPPHDPTRNAGEIVEYLPLFY
ncbi:gephyrin-like molybdotransferase Glp [Paracoccus alkanivorans]|uniref:Molybdopterin molybdenumtransferase n=1 Tax=Paracoccus alkanivorans TaxID=2116655 RepID=A0A3M0MDJ8_9RHOB|nr:gephyrin-like molybdotransferase Glp [Paracoccus alkanivorans]RMC33690.1 molybdopterin molybdenumtransferase MoeA [Paracoccus alkanivorans]